MLVKVQIVGRDQEGRWHQTAYAIEQQELERAVDPSAILWQLYLRSCYGVQRCEDHETTVSFPLPRTTGLQPVSSES